LGSLKGQDAGKVLAGLLLTTGCLVATLVMLFPNWTSARWVLVFLQQTMLGKGAPG